MSIARLELTDFTVFKRAEFAFCPGINVLMGENGTGKSHVLKAMYAALRASAVGKSLQVIDRFEKVLRPENLARLRRRETSNSEWSIRLWNTQDELFLLQWTCGDPPMGGIALPEQVPSTLFIPPREVLAMYNGFVAAYEGRELDFDETYYDICKALGAARLRGARAEAVAPLLAPLEKILGGKVVLKGNRFYVQQGDAETEAHLLAEGLRKIACMAYLVANGTLTRDSVVFWDEPEASLNPRLVVQVVEFVRALARAGVQVFLASHDFLLLHRLSQPAEHAVEPAVPIRFFSLYRPEPGAPVEVEAAPTLADIEHNAILDEFARYYDDERAYAWREMTGEVAPKKVASAAKKSTARASAKKATRSRAAATAKTRSRPTRSASKKAAKATAKKRGHG